MELMPSYGARVVRFSVFEADLRAGELRRNGVKVKLQNQPFQILAMLLERPGEIVTRDEMRARLWPAETFVDFDHSIKSAIRRLRDALGDSAESPTFIETLGGRGYRFLFPVQRQPVERTSSGSETAYAGMAEVVPISRPASEPETSLPAPVQRRWKLKVAIAVAVLTAAASLLVSLSDESSYLARTRLGMLARRTVLGQRGEMRPTVSQRRLTANPQDAPVTSAVISPDGQYLAFSDKTGFYLRQIDGGETHPIQLPEGFRPIAESWFPDSDHLVVSWAQDPNARPSLWTISVLGGTPRRIAEEGSSARVSPDGSRIVYQRNGIGRNELWLMQTDGAGAHRVVGDGGTDGEFFSPVAWAPDGRRVAYIRTTVTLYNAAERRATRKIEVGDLSTGKFEVVVSDPQLEGALGWIDDNSLLYSRQEPTPSQNDFGLWRIRLDPKTGHLLRPGVQVMSGHGSAAQLSVSKDGKSSALRTMEQHSDVYISELEAGGQRLTVPQRLTLDDRGDFVFAWTPDSKAVVFLSDRDGPIHIFKQAIDQSQPELLVGGDDALAIPRLNPAGTDLLYLVMPKQVQPSQNVRIMRVPLAGGPSQVVLEAQGIWNEQCARLPATLCIFSPGGSNQQRFFSFDPVTGAGTELVSARINKDVGFPNWSLSPDGKYLATRILRPSQDAAIRILSIADGSESTIEVKGWSQLVGIDWAADDKSLWAAGVNRKRSGFGGPATCSLLGIDLDGNARAMARVSDVCFLAGIPSPDGRYIALEGAKADSSNVWLLKSF
jgi:DNA-binding winged helix-turn-helix (wHTH) protein/Tol biopolymer transport system component